VLLDDPDEQAAITNPTESSAPTIPKRDLDLFGNPKVLFIFILPPRLILLMVICCSLTLTLALSFLLYFIIDSKDRCNSFYLLRTFRERPVN
jgi:hypothetical protein